MSAGLGPTWRSVRHTRPRQLLARLRLMVKRRAMAALARRVPGMRRSLATDTPALSASPPPPLFGPRLHAIASRGGKVWLRILAQEFPLKVPMDWHPAELEHGTRLGKLQLHYMEYLEALDDREFAATVRDWIEHNLRYGPGYWLGEWNSYALSIRCLVWMQQIARRGDRLPEDLRERMRESLAAQLRFLTNNLELDLVGNHLLKNIKALIWAGRFFTGPEAKRFADLGVHHLRRELAEQILADGFHFERSPAYHAQVFADLLEIASVLPAGALDGRLRDVLKNMAQVLVDTTHPDGGISLFNDGGLHAAYQPSECLDVYARGASRVAPRAVFGLPEAGYFGARRGQSYLLADCGPIAPDFLPAHGHGDILAFEWSPRGTRLLVDAGVYEYNASPMREYSRSTAAHNTVTVDGADQCEFYGAFRVGRRAHPRVHAFSPTAQGFVLEGSHDGYRHLPGAPTHSRRLVVSDPDRIEVADRIDGGQGQRVRAHLLCHPECRVTVNSAGARLERGRIHAVLLTASPVTLENAWFCPDFGIRLQTTRIVLEYAPAPCTGGFSIHVE